MKARIKMEVFTALSFWITSVTGKVDVFCYETGGVDPKRSDHPAYNDEREYQLLNQESWDQVAVVSIFYLPVFTSHFRHAQSVLPFQKIVTIRMTSLQ